MSDILNKTIVLVLNRNWQAKREQFGTLWPRVQAVLEALEALDIHVVDVSPSNIAFLD
jgi:hypothetical protein